MKESFLILLLQVINAKADVTAMENVGLSYSQIARLISDSIETGYVLRDEGHLRLTESGLKKMRTDLGRDSLRKDGGWISPLDEMRIEKMAIDDIYLPSEEDSFF